MSIVLALDTSTEYLSLALQHQDNTDFCITKVGSRHSDLIIDHINKLLTKNKIHIRDIDKIMYIEGPGSFTGLRIGLSVALGLSYAIGASLIPVPSFMLYVQQLRNTLMKPYLTIGIDARLGEIYLATIDIQTMQYIVEPTLVKPSEIIYQDNTAYVGSGFTIYQQQIQSQILDNLIILDDYPNALNMLQLINHIKPVMPQEATLSYLRNKVALNLAEQALNK